MPKLITDFFVVAQSGPTVDGRTINPQDLLDMAATYDPNKYTAKIWPEHMRWRAMGEVVELRAVEDKRTGIVTLENRITPYDDLMYYVRRGVMTQPSIEIIPDFAKTGKAYQFGLGATDEPASLGTESIPLQFNTAEYKQRMELYCQRVALDAQVSAEQVQIFNCPVQWADLEFKQERKFFNLGKFFSRDPKPSPTEDDIEMTKDELKEVLAGFKSELKAELKQDFNQKSTEPAAPAATSDEDVKAKVQAFMQQVGSDFKTMQQQVAKFAALGERFEAFMAESPDPKRPEQSGGSADDVWDWN